MDDILIAAETSTRLVHHFLGMKIVHDDASGQVWIGQLSYTKSLLQKFGMEAATPVATPVDTGTKLVRITDDDKSFDQAQYQSAIGSLLYLSVATRPDLAIAVKQCS